MRFEEVSTRAIRAVRAGRVLSVMQGLFFRDQGLWRAVFVLLAALSAVYGGYIASGRPLSRVDIVCNDALWIGTCGESAAYPRHSDWSPALINYPYRLWVGEELRAFSAPGWNPYVALGAPTSASLQGTGPNPLFLPFYLRPSVRAHDLAIVGQLFFAGVFTFLLARRLGAGDAGSTFASIAYAFSGYVGAYHAFSGIPSAALLPALLYAIEVLVAEGSLAAMIGAGLAFGLSATAGHPESNFLAPQAGALYFLVRLIQLALRRRYEELRRAAGLALGALALCLAVAAGPLLGFYELLSEGYTYKHGGAGSSLIELVLNRTRNLAGLAILSPQTLRDFHAVNKGAAYPDYVLPYTGLATLALASYAAASRRAPLALGVLFAYGVALCYGVGPLRSIAGYRHIYAMYSFFVPALPVAVAGGLGLQAVVKRGLGAAAWVIGIGLMLFSVTIGLALWGPAPGGAEASWRSFVSTKTMTPTGLASAFGWSALIFLLLLVSARQKRLRAIGALGAAVLLAVDLADATSFSRGPALAVDPMARESAGLRFLRSVIASAEERDGIGSARVAGYDIDSPAVNTATAFHLRDIRQVDALLLGRYNLYISALSPQKANTYRYVDRYGSPLLDLAGVRFIGRERVNGDDYWRLKKAGRQGKPLPRTLEGDPSKPLVYEDEGFGVYENRRALPRAFLVRAMREAKSPEEARDLLLRLAHPGDPGETVASIIILEPAADGTPPPLLPEGASPLPEAEAEEVRWLSDEPNRLLLSVNAVSPAYLLLADSYSKHWTAWIDGQSTPIFPADLGFRGVYVRPGRHVIELRYRPFWRVLYGLLTYPTLMIGAGLALFLRKRRGSTQPS